MVRTLINNIFADPFVGLGVLGTTVQGLVVKSEEVEMLKQLGEMTPNEWSVFAPGLATTILILCKAFVLVRGHFIKTGKGGREEDEL